VRKERKGTFCSFPHSDLALDLWDLEELSVVLSVLEERYCLNANP